MHSLVFKTLSEAIPHVIETGFSWFKSWTEPEPVKPQKNRPTLGIYHKPHDMTRITGEQYDIALMDKLIADETNSHLPRKQQIKQDQLTAQLNYKLGLNKSKSFYGRIWSGHMDRPESTSEQLK